MTYLDFSPQTKMLHQGYDPANSFGSVKMPLYQTSTYVFESAEQGEAFFQRAYGLSGSENTADNGMLYSRINHPNAVVAEERLTAWDGAEEAAVFQSGMAAISTVLLTYLRPGDTLLFSQPSYGGTQHFIRHLLTEMGVYVVAFDAYDTEDDIVERIYAEGREGTVKMIFAETPANPTSDLFDLELCRRCADRLSLGENRIKLVVDNTYLGPLWAKPMDHGADIVVYSLTKYVGGHSDLIAGAVLGSNALVSEIKMRRGLLGNMATPYTCWLILRSLETLQLRMERQLYNARIIAEFLQQCPAVSRVYYPGLLRPEDDQYRVFCRQYKSAGAMISFTLDGTKESAFSFLNQLEVFKLAVSLGGTESLAQHPYTMTHAGMAEEDKQKSGIRKDLVRLSIGIESVDDLICDLEKALHKTGSERKIVDSRLKIDFQRELT